MKFKKLRPGFELEPLSPIFPTITITIQELPKILSIIYIYIYIYIYNFRRIVVATDIQY